MKKILMSLIIISITIITIGFMYNNIFKLNSKTTLNENNLYKNEISIQQDKYNNDKEKLVDKENINNKEEKSFDKKSDDKFSKDESIKKVENSNENNSVVTNEGKNSKVFKVNKYTLLQKLPMKDKVKLLYMCRRLSTIDMGNIKEYMKSSNEVEASAEIFKILRQRLPKEDYNEIKKILDPYVDINYIESNI